MTGVLFGIIVTAIGGILAVFAASWKGGKAEKGRAAEDTIKRVENGNEAVADDRDSDANPADRVRRNDSKW